MDEIGKDILHMYFYDYFIHFNLTETAKYFALEANVNLRLIALNRLRSKFGDACCSRSKDKPSSSQKAEVSQDVDPTSNGFSLYFLYYFIRNNLTETAKTLAMEATLDLSFIDRDILRSYFGDAYCSPTKDKPSSSQEAEASQDVDPAFPKLSQTLPGSSTETSTAEMALNSNSLSLNFPSSHQLTNVGSTGSEQAHPALGLSNISAHFGFEGSTSGDQAPTIPEISQFNADTPGSSANTNLHIGDGIS